MGEQGLEFLIITSRRTKRLIVPKGWPMPGRHDAAAAAIEADEEARVRGHIDPRPFGSFEYLKEVGLKPIPVEACVFPFRVKKVKSTWKECKQRKRKWLPAAAAAARLDDSGLRLLVKRYAESIA